MRSSIPGTIGAIVVAFFLWVPLRSLGQPVHFGYDLLHTGAGTTFMGAPFTGVPLGTYDFGGVVGVKNVGQADTIVRRSSAAIPGAIPGTAPAIGIELVALHLQSTAPIDLGLGVDFYYMTLQSERGGPASVGNESIGFASASGGSFSSSINLFFDIRKGSVSGPIGLSDSQTLSNTGSPWSRTPPAGALTIDLANHFLDGFSATEDFWPTGTFTKSFPTGSPFVLSSATPEPASALALILLAFPLVAHRRC